MQSIVDNWKVLNELWEECLETKLEREVRARIIGVSHQMTTFNYFFAVKLGALLLKHSDNLSKTLQKTRLSAGEAQSIASFTVATLEKMRSDDSFMLFWQSCNTEAKELKVGEPVLPRKRSRPIRYYLGNATAEFPDTVDSHYRAIYYEAIDTVTSCIKSRFGQNDYMTYYSKLESLLLKSVKGNLNEKNTWPLSVTSIKMILTSFS